MFRITVSAAILVVTAMSSIAEAPNSLLTLQLHGTGSENATDYVYGTCEQNVSKMKCHLSISFVESPKTESEIQANIAKQLPYWRQGIKQHTPDQICSYIKVFRTGPFLDEPDATSAKPAFTARVKQLLQQETDTTEAMCHNPTEENAVKLMRARENIENVTCKVHVTEDDVLFTRQSSHVWVYNSGKPSGLCGVVSVGTLTNNSVRERADWTYDVTSINTQPGDLCGNKRQNTERFVTDHRTGARECVWVAIY